MKLLDKIGDVLIVRMTKRELDLLSERADRLGGEDASPKGLMQKSDQEANRLLDLLSQAAVDEDERNIERRRSLKMTEPT